MQSLLLETYSETEVWRSTALPEPGNQLINSSRGATFANRYSFSTWGTILHLHLTFISDGVRRLMFIPTTDNDGGLNGGGI